jgi:hypothetical protein
MDRRWKNSLRRSLRGGVESVWLGGLDSNQDNQIQNLYMDATAKGLVFTFK